MSKCGNAIVGHQMHEFHVLDILLHLILLLVLFLCIILFFLSDKLSYAVYIIVSSVAYILFKHASTFEFVIDTTQKRA